MKQLALLAATLILATGISVSQEVSGAPGMPPMSQVSVASHPALMEIQPIMTMGEKEKQLAQENMNQDQVAVDKSEAKTTEMNQEMEEVRTQVAEKGNVVKQTGESSAQTLGQMGSPLTATDS